jgi:hypothetical protein
MSISDYLELQILDAVFNNDVGDLPVAAVYVKLHTGDPGEAGTGNAATETDRIQATFGAAASGAVANDADVEWTNVAGSETYSHVSLWDASTSGNCLWTGALTSPVAVVAGNDFTIPTGDLDVTLQ